jgi:ribonuclease HI
MSHRLFTDGGARNNPGPAAIGGVLYDGDTEFANFSEYIGEATNNRAEYRAILRGVELALEKNILELDCFLDSQLIVEQLNKRYKVKDKELAKLFVKVWNLTVKFKHITFTHVRREKNKEADALVNKALDNR